MPADDKEQGSSFPLVLHEVSTFQPTFYFLCCNVVVVLKSCIKGSHFDHAFLFRSHLVATFATDALVLDGITSQYGEVGNESRSGTRQGIVRQACRRVHDYAGTRSTWIELPAAKLVIPEFYEEANAWAGSNAFESAQDASTI